MVPDLLPPHPYAELDVRIMGCVLADTPYLVINGLLGVLGVNLEGHRQGDNQILVRVYGHVLSQAGGAATGPPPPSR